MIMVLIVLLALVVLVCVLALVEARDARREANYLEREIANSDLGVVRYRPNKVFRPGEYEVGTPYPWIKVIHKADVKLIRLTEHALIEAIESAKANAGDLDADNP